MLPTLRSGDTVFVDPAYYTEKSFKRNDLVAIQFSSRKRPMVKRIIAVAGDSVTINNGRIHLNDIPLEEPYLSGPRILSPKAAKLLSLQLSRYSNRVPKANCIMMGDNTKNSFDSGDYGFVSESQVVGMVSLNVKRKK